MRIEQNSAVLIHYRLTNTAGELIDTSTGQTPLAYLHGHKNLVDGLERALEGQEAGAKLDVEVAPADGYGDRDPSLDISVALSEFPARMHASLRPGAMFQGPNPSDPTHPATYTVMERTDSTVLCTANHPLAGMTLHFSVEVLEVRAPTAAELSNGRVLSPAASGASSCCNDPNCDR